MRRHPCRTARNRGIVAGRCAHRACILRAKTPITAGLDMPALETCSPVSTAVSPCPGCQNPLYLTSRLHGRLVRCRSCRGVLAVVAVSEQGHTAEDPAANSPPHSNAATPCPNCHSALYLTPELHGRFVQCRSCRSVLAVLRVAVRSEPVAEVADAPVAAWDTARNPTGLAAPAAPPGNGKRRAGAVSQPRLSASGKSPQRPPADPKSVRPPENRVVAAEKDRTEAGFEPDSLSEPEVLSDEDAFDFLADLDSREERSGAATGPTRCGFPRVCRPRVARRPAVRATISSSRRATARPYSRVAEATARPKTAAPNG